MLDDILFVDYSEKFLEINNSLSGLYKEKDSLFNSKMDSHFTTLPKFPIFGANRSEIRFCNEVVRISPETLKGQNIFFIVLNLRDIKFTDKNISFMRHDVHFVINAEQNEGVANSHKPTQEKMSQETRDRFHTNEKTKDDYVEVHSKTFNPLQVKFRGCEFLLEVDQPNQEGWRKLYLRDQLIFFKLEEVTDYTGIGYTQKTLPNDLFTQNFYETSETDANELISFRSGSNRGRTTTRGGYRDVKPIQNLQGTFNIKPEQILLSAPLKILI